VAPAPFGRAALPLSGDVLLQADSKAPLMISVQRPESVAAPEPQHPFQPVRQR
jgi:hypothetical protein